MNSGLFYDVHGLKPANGINTYNLKIGKACDKCYHMKAYDTVGVHMEYIKDAKMII